MGRNRDKERADVPEPEPVLIGGTRYIPVLWGKTRGLGQNGGILAAVDIATGRELWVRKIYEISYDGRMEGDKQDLFITDIQVANDGKSLLIRDESRRQFRFDLQTLSATLETPLGS